MVEDKISLIQQKLKDNQYFIICDKSNIFYLTGIKNIEDGSVYLLITKDRYFVLTNSLMYTQIKNVFKCKNVLPLKNLKDQLSKLLPKNCIFEVDTEYIPYRTYKTLLKINKNIRFNNLISKLRQLKTFNEIKNIKKSCKIIKKIIQKTKKYIHYGVTEVEVKNFILKTMLEYNVEPSFEPIVAFDENTSFPHHISSSNKFTKKSLVLLDIGCKYNGYCCDITRMFNVSNTNNKKIIEFYDRLKFLQKKLIYLCKPGVKVKDIDLYAREFFKKLGYAKNYLHCVGHGLGIDIHEPPRVCVKDDTILQPGMVITIEPGIYFENEFGLRIEDDILITSDGREVLT